MSAEPTSSPLDAEAVAREQDLLRAVNDYRAAQGLLRWREDAGLAAIARAHSRRMAREGRLSHEGFRQRALRAGSVLCVENLVAGHASGEQAVAMWRRSPAHLDNLLDPGAQWAGVGVAGRFATLLACATPAAPVGEPLDVQEGEPSGGRESLPSLPLPRSQPFAPDVAR
ncbi:MAG: CAP domain-containing protein [Rhodoferax sp.]|nr:CAP domain-containing protein [Rhodoferax sp.]